MSWESQRVDFQPDEFYKVIEQKGYETQWEKAIMCPCLEKDRDGQPNPVCPLCEGKGKFWYDPKTIKGIMTNFGTQERFTSNGEIISGTSYFTTHAVNKIGFWDRVTMYNSIIRFSQVIEKGDFGGKDKLRFTPINVNMLRSVKTVYVLGVDFTTIPAPAKDPLNEIGYIDWSGSSNQPMRGEKYTIDYLIHPRFICIDLVNVLRDTQIKHKNPGIAFTEMPVRAVVRLEWFVLP